MLKKGDVITHINDLPSENYAQTHLDDTMRTHQRLHVTVIRQMRTLLDGTRIPEDD